MNFLAELIARLFSANPTFFKIIQIVSVVIGAVSAILAFLHGKGVELPGAIAWLDSAVVTVSSIIAAIMAQLPNTNPPAEAKA